MSSYLLVHGGWAGGWVWGDLAERLENAGHQVRVVDQLPSAGTDPTELEDLNADAAYVRNMLDTFDEPVVLVGHSSGGMVITEVADHPKIWHSVYLAAFWPQRDQSLADLVGDGPPPGWQVFRDDGTASITDDLETAREALCADLDVERTASFHSRLVLQSVAAFTTPSTAPDRSHPTTYIVCDQDNAIAVAAQEAMSANANTVIRLPASHMVQLSRPDELAEALGRI